MLICDIPRLKKLRIQNWEQSWAPIKGQLVSEPFWWGSHGWIGILQGLRSTKVLHLWWIMMNMNVTWETCKFIGDKRKYFTCFFKDVQQRHKFETWFSLNKVHNDADKHSVLSSAFRQQKHRGQTFCTKNLCIPQRARNVSHWFSFPSLQRVNHHWGSNTERENRQMGVEGPGGGQGTGADVFHAAGLCCVE